MSEALQKQLGDLLQKLGIGIGDAVPLLVRYTVYDSLVSLVGSAVFLVLIALTVRFFWQRSENFRDSDAKGITRAIVSIVGSIIVTVFLLTFFSSISALIEPRGYLVHKLIEKVSK